jgi:thioredoxin reductase (NADPH)
MAVLLAVAPDDRQRAALDEVLRRRFGSDYSIVVTGDGDDARARLTALGAAGEVVAVVIAPYRLGASGGIELLREVRAVHPTARRVLMLDVGDVSAADDLSRALTLAQVDFYFGQPWASPEEEVYPVLAEALRLWAREHQPRYEKTVIVDVANGARGAQLRAWLEGNHVATTLLTADAERALVLLDTNGLTADRFPVAVLYDGRVFVEPSRAELAEALGAFTHPPRERYDVAIVGSGPAGLAAAVYAGSEGLAAIVVEGEVVGGQAGTSTKIRNYLGFPWGVSGSELAELASRQAGQLGADFVFTRPAVALRAEGDDRIVTLAGGDEIRSTAVVLAGGVAYRRLGVPAVDSLVGMGVFYGAGASEARAMGGLDVFVLGGGNSAGQSAAHLASAGARVTVLIRGASIAASMSDYLVQELDAAGVKVRCNTEVVGAGSETRLEHLDLRDRTTDETETVAADALFIFIGARPHTDWLAGPLALDDNGFVLTGRDLTEHGAERWPLDRPPAWLETSIPGVFAAGDIRHGSVKRVAAAVGEGSTAAMLVREYLASR